MTSMANLQPSRRGPTPSGFDLLRIPALRKLIVWPGFPYVFQTALLLVFLGIAALGWGLYTPEGLPDKLYAKTNLVNLLIWGLWWPMMVWVAVLFGRLWCAVCPLEIVSNVSERIGALLGVPQRNLAKWLRAGWVMLLLYVTIQLLVSGLHLHRVPMYTSLFMLGLLAASGAIGFFMKDRAFCRGFCPVGLLLNVYGRGGMLAVRAGDAGTCAGCEGKDCIKSCNRQNLDARSCPSLLNPPKLNSSKDCLICGQCIKSCRPDNMQLLLRRPFSSLDARESLASWPVTLFVMAVSGFVTYEVSGGWQATATVFLWIPEKVANLLGLVTAVGWFKGVWVLMFFPVLMWSLLGLLAIRTGGATSLGEAMRCLALPMAVVVASAHMAKGLEKLSTWGSFLPGALRNVDGINTANAIHSGAIGTPGALIPHAVYAIGGVALLAFGLGFALREVRLADPKRRRPGFNLGLALTALMYGGCVAGWGLR